MGYNWVNVVPEEPRMEMTLAKHYKLYHNRRGSGMTRQIWSTINTPPLIDKIWAGLIRQSNNDKEESYTDASTDKIAAYEIEKS